MKKEISIPIVIAVVVVVIGIIAFLALRPKAGTIGVNVNAQGMPPDVAAEFNKRMQQGGVTNSTAPGTGTAPGTVPAAPSSR